MTRSKPRRRSATVAALACLALAVSAVQAQTDALRAQAESVRIGEIAALHAPGDRVCVDGMSGDALRSVLYHLAALDPDAFEAIAPGGDARLVLQNDIWGLWQRCDALEAPSDAALTTRNAAAVLVFRLAPDAANTPPDGVDPTVFPDAIAGVLEAFEPRESQMPILSHELAFGGRRIFHVAASGEGDAERALYSTLVGLDAAGQPYATSVVGDLEMLRFQGDTLVDARVFELWRNSVGVRQTSSSVHEVSVVHTVPGLGHNQTVAVFEPPQPLSDLPCAGCHDDAFAMSLPSAELALGQRVAGVLEFAGRNAPTPPSR